MAVDGYNRFAELIGTHPDLAMFRRFSTLNSKNILFMQGELIHLETQLRDIACEDRTSDDPERVAFEFCIRTLKGPHDSVDKKEQWSKILEVRDKLKEYSPWQQIPEPFPTR